MRGGNGNPALRLTAHNGSGAALHNFMVQFNKNAMGLAPASQVSHDSGILSELSTVAGADGSGSLASFIRKCMSCKHEAALKEAWRW